MLSGDGRCRPFDAAASGTVFGHGAGLLLLKRLEDAVADGDNIRAILRGFAVTNDGARKAGYMAPAVDGQRRAIRAAQQMAGVSPADISYVEAHGTGTPLGDPIELTALTEAFREETTQEGFCTVGSVKGNIGHMDAAAGVAGVIRTVLALEHRTLPGLLNFVEPNPHLPLENSPFRFHSDHRTWPGDRPRIAGVSAFGVGGVNAHVVLQEAPRFQPQTRPDSTEAVPFCISARTPEALRQLEQQLAGFLKTASPVNLRDIAGTLFHGRAHHTCRHAFTAATVSEAIAHLRHSSDPQAHVESPAARAATAWIAGDIASCEAFFATEPWFRVPLPTYPFQRQRYWIEPPARDSQKTGVEQVAQVVTGQAASMQERVAAALTEISGTPIPPQEWTRSFVELGLDSLLLTQASQTLSKTFATPVSFRQLMETLDSVERLSRYLESKLSTTAAVAIHEVSPTNLRSKEESKNSGKAELASAAAATMAASEAGHAFFREPHLRAQESVDPRATALPGWPD